MVIIKALFFLYSCVTSVIYCKKSLSHLKSVNTKYVCRAASSNFISARENCCITSDENKLWRGTNSTICRKLHLMQIEHVKSIFSYAVEPIIRFSKFKYNEVKEQLEVPGIFSEIWQNTLKTSCRIHSNKNNDFVRLHLILGVVFPDFLNTKKEANGILKTQKTASKLIGIKWGKDWLDVSKDFKENEKNEQDCAKTTTKKLLSQMFHKEKIENNMITFLTRVYDVPLTKFSADTKDKTYVFPLFKAFPNEKSLKYFSLIEFLKKTTTSPLMNFDKSIVQGCALVSCEKASTKNNQNFNDLQKRISENFIKIKSYAEKLSTTNDPKQIKKKNLILSHIVHTLETRLNKRHKNLDSNNEFIEPNFPEVSEICMKATVSLLDFFKKKYQDQKINNVISYIEDIKAIVPAETVSDEQSNSLQTMLKDVVFLKQHPFSNQMN